MTLQSFQVLQRAANGAAQITQDNGTIVEITTGGPYEIGDATDVLVGDIWVLAGQSNMEGCGRQVDMETSSPLVRSLQSREVWAVAEEPLHWLDESPRPVHRKINGMPPPPEVPDPRNSRDYGAGLGLTFAKLIQARTGVPVGLIPSAHGGTSMDQWNPARAATEGDHSLYGATLSRIRESGGKVAGILWYQGESDASPEDAPKYADRMIHLIQSFRTDLGQPDLPFYLVQLGTFVTPGDADQHHSWSAIREAQRLLPQALPYVGVVSAIDLDLDDGIHISTAGLKRLGKRLANVVSGFPSPELGEIKVARPAVGNYTIVRVSFQNVRGGLRAEGRPYGFSLRDAAGNDIHQIFKTTLEGDTAILHVGCEVLPAGLSLWYGYGLDSYCNITDAEDAAIPAFGPISISTDSSL
ncbi:hypothetical protein CCAX7_27260 [Capsulimonas corticalis]|uniref:Uncharacterized protein n=1 Tax=Capsulimonas corticalis TaxID=2219043 RepID=A0A402CTP0_9BACT|nr:sialate O-acetylesterase [Capsulimonas corticalis]BDI30675.1 hypothetical protein CCAX7_27260 [Capsulimonas corticalis]